VSANLKRVLGERTRTKAVVAVAVVAWLAAAGSHAATTDSIRVKAFAAKSEYRIGDRIEFDVVVEWKSPAEPIRVEPDPALGQFGILRSPELKRKRIGLRWRQERTRYFLAAFETGEFTIPGFTVVYRDADDSEKRIATSPVNITVQSVVAQAASNEGIREAKPPVIPPALFESKTTLPFSACIWSLFS